WGRVVASPVLLKAGVTIELVSRDESIRQKAKTFDGTFEFGAVPAGMYGFRLSDHDGNVLLRWSRTLQGQHDHEIFHLPVDQEEAKWQDSVSVRQLGHKTPKEAMKAFQEAMKDLESGEQEKAVSNLEQAVLRDPQFAEAQTALATELLLTNHLEEGLLHARLAYESSPRVMRTAHTLAAGLITAKHYQEAENLVRSVINGQPHFSPYNPELNALLALSLIGQRQYTEEAFELVERAASSYPSSRLLVANTLVETGQTNLALEQVQKYLDTSASRCERADLENWIARSRARLGMLASLP
ncbi:MAG TPA: hypothetical protein VFE51_25580, partial [Verrucomicrobiae bacterium]|nr:hypothetical protein [Verrucomicrobiae bacterium]